MILKFSCPSVLHISLYSIWICVLFRYTGGMTFVWLSMDGFFMIFLLNFTLLPECIYYVVMCTYMHASHVFRLFNDTHPILQHCFLIIICKFSLMYFCLASNSVSFLHFCKGFLGLMIIFSIFWTDFSFLIFYAFLCHLYIFLHSEVFNFVHVYGTILQCILIWLNATWFDTS